MFLTYSAAMKKLPSDSDECVFNDKQLEAIAELPLHLEERVDLAAELEGMLDNAPTTPKNMYGDE